MAFEGLHVRSTAFVLCNVRINTAVSKTSGKTEKSGDNFLLSGLKIRVQLCIPGVCGTARG